MKRLLTLLVLGVLGLVGLTACMGDDDGGSAREQRRAAALVQTATPGSGLSLTIAGLTPLGKAIEVDSYQWALSHPSGGNTQFEALTITKHLDELSPLLYRSAALGTAHATASLKLHASDGQGGVVNYATYDLTNVRLSQVADSGNTNNLPTEQVTLNFTAMKMTSASVQNGTVGKAESFTFDVTTQKG